MLNFNLHVYVILNCLVSLTYNHQHIVLLRSLINLSHNYQYQYFLVSKSFECIYSEPNLRLRNPSMDSPGGSELFEDTSGAVARSYMG